MIEDLRRKARDEFFGGRVACGLRVAKDLAGDTREQTVYGMDASQVRQLKEFWMRHHEELPKPSGVPWALVQNHDSK